MSLAVIIVSTSSNYSALFTVSSNAEIYPLLINTTKLPPGRRGGTMMAWEYAWPHFVWCHPTLSHLVYKRRTETELIFWI